MRKSVATLIVAIGLGLVFAIASVGAAPVAAAQELDTEVPPGNPVLGDDRPGDIQAGSETNYVMWGLVAVCLIGAGVLLIKIERWEARRIEHQIP